MDNMLTLPSVEYKMGVSSLSRCLLSSIYAHININTINTTQRFKQRVKYTSSLDISRYPTVSVLQW